MGNFQPARIELRLAAVGRSYLSRRYRRIIFELLDMAAIPQKQRDRLQNHLLLTRKLDPSMCWFSVNWKNWLNELVTSWPQFEVQGIVGLLIFGSTGSSLGFSLLRMSASMGKVTASLLQRSIAASYGD